MILLIDGYNLLKRLEGAQEHTKQQKAAFRARLQRYALHKRHTIELVFDGGGNPYPSKEQAKNLTIWYSGYKQSADDVIRAYLDKHAHQAKIVLISSDRELRNHAARHAVESLSADEFLALLRTAESAKIEQEHDQRARKTTQVVNPDLDVLMESAPIQIKDDDEMKKRQRSEVVAKKEKKKLQILKKL